MDYAKTITISNILEKLETECIQEVTNEFQEFCRLREMEIKKTINICTDQIVELAQAPGIETLTKRQKIKVGKCLENTTKYISELMDILTTEKIIQDCIEIQKSIIPFQRNIPFEPDIILLVQNSFHSAIAKNILWAPRVTVTEAIELGRGELDLDKLGRHLPDIINDLKSKVIPFCANYERYSGFSDSIKEAVKCYEKKLFRACNLIIITTIEGMVRKLSIQLAKNQGITDFKEDNHTSLNSLLRDVSWKKDYKIGITQLELITDQRHRSNSANRDIEIVEDEYAMVDINTRLDFLKGRFKDDRDLILHGSYQEYNKKWNLFLNLSALYEVYQTCLYYEVLYVSES